MMAGQYNELIRLYYSIETENEYGERTVEQRLVFSTRARHEETGGSRQNENNEIVYDHTKTFFVRSYVPVTDTSIIEFDGRKYRVITFERRRDHNDIRIVTELINE